MWFVKSRKNRSRRADHSLFDERISKRLRVQSRVSLKSKTRFRWFGGFLVLLVSLLSLAVVLWVGVQFLNRYLLQQNDLFRIRDFKIECSGDVITSKHVMDYAELAGASNLFSLNIAEKRDFLQKKVPRVKSVKISRRLPGELVIEVQERISIARLEMKGYYLTVDREGCVLGPSTGASQLPVISGHSMPGLRPGLRLGGIPVMNALEVFDICETTQIRGLFKVLRIDLRNREALELSLGTGERVLLAWPQMGNGDALERDHLEQKLLKLAEILKTAAAQGKRVVSLDMTLENNFPAIEYY